MASETPTDQVRTSRQSLSRCGPALPPQTFEKRDEDLGRRADVVLRPPGQLEGLGADEPSRAGVRRVIEARWQLVELGQVNVAEPEQRPVAGRQELRHAVVLSRFQGRLEKCNMSILTADTLKTIGYVPEFIPRIKVA